MRSTGEMRSTARTLVRMMNSMMTLRAQSKGSQVRKGWEETLSGERGIAP